MQYSTEFDLLLKNANLFRMLCYNKISSWSVLYASGGFSWNHVIICVGIYYYVPI